MRKKKNPSCFDLVLSDRHIAGWLSKQHRRAAIVEGALAHCLSAGPGSDAFMAMFIPAEARAPWLGKTGHGKQAKAFPATSAPVAGGFKTLDPAPPQRRNGVLGDYAAPVPATRPGTAGPSAAGDFK